MFVFWVRVPPIEFLLLFVTDVLQCYQYSVCVTRWEQEQQWAELLVHQ